MKGIFGVQIFNLDEVDSTNNFAAKLISDQLCQNGAVIMSDYQTLGKGQRGNHWISNKRENIMMSVVYQPDNMSVSEQITLTWGTSLAVVELLTEFGISAQVKWPNDIYVNRKKIAGVLIENQLMGKRVSFSIIGIGLNVNQLEFGLTNATSIALEKNKIQIIEEVRNTLLAKMNDLLFKDFIFLKQKYESLLFLKDHESEFEDEQGVFKGKIKGVTDEGLLIILKENRLKNYGIKQLTFRTEP